MKELYKNLAIILAFVLVLASMLGYGLTRDNQFLILAGSLATGYFALARGRENPQQQTVNAEKVENLDNSNNDKEK